MKQDKFYKSLIEKMNTVSAVPPQEVGPLTVYWKLLVPFFKTSPLKLFALFGFISSIVLWLIFGSSISRLTTILQYGF